MKDSIEPSKIDNQPLEQRTIIVGHIDIETHPNSHTIIDGMANRNRSYTITFLSSLITGTRNWITV